MDRLAECRPEFDGGAAPYLDGPNDDESDEKVREATTRVFLYFETVAKGWSGDKKGDFWDRVSVQAFDLLEGDEREIILDPTLSHFVEGEHHTVIDLGQVRIADQVFKVSMQAQRGALDPDIHKMLNLIVDGADGSYSGEMTPDMTAFEKKVDREIQRSISYLTDHFEKDSNVAVAAVQFDCVFQSFPSAFRTDFIQTMSLKYQLAIGEHIETLQKKIAARQVKEYVERGGGIAHTMPQYEGVKTQKMIDFESLVDAKAIEMVAFMEKHYRLNPEDTMISCGFDLVFEENPHIGDFDPKFVEMMRIRYKDPISRFQKKLQRQSGVGNVIEFNGSELVAHATDMSHIEFGRQLAATQRAYYAGGIYCADGVDFITEVEEKLVVMSVPDSSIDEIIAGYNEAIKPLVATAAPADGQKPLTAGAITAILKVKMAISLSLVVYRIIERLRDQEVTPAKMVNMGFNQAISYFDFPGLTGAQKEIMEQYYNEILLLADSACTIESPEEFVDVLINEEMNKGEQGFMMINGVLINQVKAALNEQFVSSDFIAHIEKDYLKKRSGHLGYGLDQKETDMGKYEEYQDMIDGCDETFDEAIAAYPHIQGVLLFQAQLEKEQGPQALRELDLLELEEESGICVSPVNRLYLKQGYEMALAEYSRRRGQMTTEDLIALAKESRTALDNMYDGSMEGLPAVPGRAEVVGPPSQMHTETYQIDLDPLVALQHQLAQEEADIAKAKKVEVWSRKSEAREAKVEAFRKAEERRAWGQTPEGKAAAKKAAKDLIDALEREKSVKGTSQAGKSTHSKGASKSSKKKKKRRQQKAKPAANASTNTNQLSPAEIAKRTKEKAARRLETQEAQAASEKKKKAAKRERQKLKKREAKAQRALEVEQARKAKRNERKMQVEEKKRKREELIEKMKAERRAQLENPEEKKRTEEVRQRALRMARGLPE